MATSVCNFRIIDLLEFWEMKVSDNKNSGHDDVDDGDDGEYCGVACGGVGGGV